MTPNRTPAVKGRGRPRHRALDVVPVVSSDTEPLAVHHRTSGGLPLAQQQRRRNADNVSASTHRRGSAVPVGSPAARDSVFDLGELAWQCDLAAAQPRRCVNGIE